MLRNLPLRRAVDLVSCAAIVAIFVWMPRAEASELKHLEPGFTSMAQNVKVVIMPTDIELFLVSAGGIPEPKADWTEAENRHFKAALTAKKKTFGVTTLELSEKDADDAAEIN